MCIYVYTIYTYLLYYNTGEKRKSARVLKLYIILLFFCVYDPHHDRCRHRRPHRNRHHPEWHSFGQIPRTATRRVCSTHVRCARYLYVENRIWVYFFSPEIKYITHTHTHTHTTTTTTPRGVIFLFKYNPHAIHHAISRLVFVCDGSLRAGIVYTNTVFYAHTVFCFPSPRMNDASFCL